MKYRIILRIKVQEDNWIKVGTNHDISWDVRGLIEKSTGLVLLNQENIGSAVSWIPSLEKGILELTHSPDSYSDYELAYGLGTLKETLEFFRGLLEDCKGHAYCELYGQII